MGNSNGEARLVPVAAVALAPEGTSLDSEELVTAWLSGRSLATVEAYRGDLRAFSAHIEAESAGAAVRWLLTAGQGEANRIVHGFRAAMLDAGLAPATVNRRLAAIRSVIRLGRSFGMVAWELEVPAVASEPYRDTRGPQADVVTRLIRELEREDSSLAVRDLAIVRLLVDMALRRGELCRLDLEHVADDFGSLTVLGKGKREPTILSVAEPTAHALRRWIEVRGREPGALFGPVPGCPGRRAPDHRLTGRGLAAIVQRRGDKIGVRLRPHALRHRAITEAVKAAQEAGIGLDEVRQYSRHADVRTLMVYRDRERDVQGELAGLVADRYDAEALEPAEQVAPEESS